MRAVIREEMQAIDRASIETHGVKGLTLMQAAGLHIAQKAVEMLRRTKSGMKAQVVVVCGAGNNGGDGFIAAHILKQKKIRVQVLLLTDADALQGDAQKAYHLWIKTGKLLTRTVTAKDLKKIAATLSECALIIDAVFGTGLQHRAQRPWTFDVLAIIRECGEGGVPVLAVDIPSGMDADTGLGVAGDECVVKAQETITFGFPKLGLLGDPGAFFAGRVTTVELPFAPEALHVEDAPHLYLDRQEIHQRWRLRKVTAHKGEFGHVVIIGGSRRMPGALGLAVEAALRGGAGKVTAVVPGRDVMLAGAPRNPEAMWLALAEDGDGFFSANSATALREWLTELRRQKAILVFGPGIGVTSGTRKMLEVLTDFDLPLVIDADGLTLLAQAPLPKSPQRPLILTPHPGEMAKLLGTDAAAVQGNRINDARKACEQYGAWVILKGFRTVIAGAHSLDINSSGNAGMARGGMGDVLSGLLGARLGCTTEFSAQGVRQALQEAVFLHGRAGDFAREACGEESLLPRDLIDHLPLAFAEVSA